MIFIKTIVINASGGGIDLGYSGNGVVEKDLMLKLSTELSEYLKSRGVNTFLVREKDETISYEDRIKKIRSKFPNPKDVLIISNSLTKSDEPGFEIVYQLNKKGTLANNISDSLEYFNTSRVFQMRWPNNTSKDYFYIMRENPDYETLIIRYGNVSIKNDMDVLKNNFDDIVKIVGDSILDYIGYSNTNLDNNTYTVVSGDTLYSIAKKYNTNVDILKQLNNLSSNMIKIGQVLKLPTSNVYVVQKGDNLWKISQMYNTSVDKLKDINNLKSDTLQIGQKLFINK